MSELKPSIELSNRNKFTELLKRLRGNGVDVAQSSLRESAEMIMADSKEHYVPVDTGFLRSSGFVDSADIDKFGRASFTMGFRTPYALSVHENPRAGKTGGLSPSGKPYEHWARTGGWKYLETPLKEAVSSGRIARKLASDLEKEFGKLSTFAESK